MNEYLDIFNDVLRIATFQPGFRDRFHHGFRESEGNRPDRTRSPPRQPAKMSERSR